MYDATTRKERVAYGRMVPSERDSTAGMEDGVIDGFIESRGFGFIQQKAGKGLFFGIWAVEPHGAEVESGMPCRYERGLDRTGRPCATRVVLEQ